MLYKERIVIPCTLTSTPCIIHTPLNPSCKVSHPCIKGIMHAVEIAVATLYLADCICHFIPCRLHLSLYALQIAFVTLFHADCIYHVMPYRLHLSCMPYRLHLSCMPCRLQLSLYALQIAFVLYALQITFVIVGLKIDYTRSENRNNIV